MSTAQINSAGAYDLPASRKANEDAPAYLLSLPGEIRNNIYGFVLDQHVTVILSKKSHTLRYDLGLVEPPAKRWPTMKRTSYGLTQVCREIRNEFMPLFRRNTTVRLSWSTLLQYSSTVFPDPAAGKGRLLIEVPDECHHKDCLDHIAILLWLKQKAPNLLIRIESPSYSLGTWGSLQPYSVRDRKMIAEFYRIANFILSCTDPDSNRQGLERALETMKDLTIVTGRRLHVYCEVYAPYAQSWMPYVGRGPVQGVIALAAKKEAVEFMRSIGLDVRGVLSLRITAEDPEASDNKDCTKDVSPSDSDPFHWSVRQIDV